MQDLLNRKAGSQPETSLNMKAEFLFAGNLRRDGEIHAGVVAHRCGGSLKTESEYRQRTRRMARCWIVDRQTSLLLRDDQVFDLGVGCGGDDLLLH